jgi:hydrogenase expression/formation protein HypE
MDKISLEHGSGGIASQELLSGIFLKHLTSPVLHTLDDCALLEEHSGRIAFSCDSYVGDPIFFRGGNIGMLAVNGTINNLAMRGAMPLALSLSVIIEEGFSVKSLDEIIRSVAEASVGAGVAVVTGDTKVVPKGRIDGICINTSGIGLVPHGEEISGSEAMPGDVIILSGALGEHGMAILASQSGLQEDCAEYRSDTQPLHCLIQNVIEEFPGSVHALRDPTRGGVATSLVWIASSSGVCINILEDSLPIRQEVFVACSRSNRDPLYLENEGICILICTPEDASEILALMRSLQAGKDAVIIGRVLAEPPGRVTLTNKAGRIKYLEPLSGLS